MIDLYNSLVTLLGNPNSDLEILFYKIFLIAGIIFVIKIVIDVFKSMFNIKF